MRPLFIEAIGVCAGGIADWQAARAMLRDEIAFVPAPPPRLSGGALPPTERRRANETSRWALQAAGEAVGDLAPPDVAALSTVFTSADGDGEVLAQILHDLAAAKVAVSPTTFHNSVFNAPGGYWSIAAHAPAASTTLCAAEGSFAAGLLEAAMQASSNEAPVLLVAYDCPFPDRSPIRTQAAAAFSCALRLAPAPGAATAHGRVVTLTLTGGTSSPRPPAFASAFAGNAAAAAVPLLHAIACQAPGPVLLPYLDGDVLAVEWTP